MKRVAGPNNQEAKLARVENIDQKVPNYWCFPSTVARYKSFGVVDTDGEPLLGFHANHHNEILQTALYSWLSTRNKTFEELEHLLAIYRQHAEHYYGCLLYGSLLKQIGEEDEVDDGSWSLARRTIPQSQLKTLNEDWAAQCRSEDKTWDEYFEYWVPK